MGRDGGAQQTPRSCMAALPRRRLLARGFGLQMKIPLRHEGRQGEGEVIPCKSVAIQAAFLTALVAVVLAVCRPFSIQALISSLDSDRMLVPLRAKDRAFSLYSLVRAA